MIKSMIRKSEYEEIYRLLDTVSPLPFDCGTLCGAVCCGTQDDDWRDFPVFNAGKDSLLPERDADELPENAEGPGWVSFKEDSESAEPEMGIYLLPGEEKVHSRKEDWLTWSEERAEDFDFPDSWKGKVFFVRCKNPPHCPREKRPIQCRTFPVSPHFQADGHLVLILNDVELPYRCPLIEEAVELNPDFLEVTYACWLRLVKDPLIRDLVMMDSEDRRDTEGEPPAVYGG